MLFMARPLTRCHMVYKIWDLELLDFTIDFLISVSWTGFLLAVLAVNYV